MGANQPKTIRDYEILGITQPTLIIACRRGASPRHARSSRYDSSFYVGALQPACLAMRETFKAPLFDIWIGITLSERITSSLCGSESAEGYSRLRNARYRTTYANHQL